MNSSLNSMTTEIYSKNIQSINMLFIMTVMPSVLSSCLWPISTQRSVGCGVRMWGYLGYMTLWPKQPATSPHCSEWSILNVFDFIWLIYANILFSGDILNSVFLRLRALFKALTCDWDKIISLVWNPTIILFWELSSDFFLKRVSHLPELKTWGEFLKRVWLFLKELILCVQNKLCN